MGKPGERFDMPDGSAYILRRPGEEDGGASVEMEFVLPSGCVPPPPHIHASQTEEYEVLEGTFEVVIEGRWQTLGPGDTATVPVGALHTFRNRSGAPVRVRNWHRPALRFEIFIEDMARTLSGAGVTRPRDPRIPMYLSKVMFKYPETLYVGRRRERLPMRVLAGLASLLPGSRS